ncbi:MAG: FHA domain-containing protein [Candidatus Aminicenantes bacterium]|nr:FHA domain-containing protein [Candidatus Aminicenantes bacterium]
MTKRCVLVGLSAVALSMAATTSAFAQSTWILDILTNPARFWNTTVTVTGQVQAVIPNPAGTTRGTYTLLDDSCPNPLTIRTEDLPPISRNFKVTGVIIQDPTAANVPIMKELSRTAPGMASTTLYLLIGAGVVFLILLITFIVLLTKPRRAAVPAGTIRPQARPAAAPTYAPPPPPPAAEPAKTMKMPTGAVPPPAAGPAKTQVFLSLGADIVIDKGPDKGKEFTLHQQVTTIGRPGTRKNDIELNDETVSKEQASIYFDNAKKQFTVANESTTNPTRINGQPLTGPMVIENGTLLEMGRTVLLFKKE